MKKGTSLLLLCMMFISPGCRQNKEVSDGYNIIPQPNKLVAQEGYFELTNKVQVSTFDCTPEVKAIANQFVDQIKLTSGISLKITEEENQQPSTIRFAILEGFAKEGYTLSVTPENVVITASEPNGFFYAIQTLYQLLPPAVYGKEMAKRATWTIPAVFIEDAPRFKYRGMHLDVCRHFSSVEYIYKYIDMLAMHKMNTFHFHLTDDQGWRIEIKKHPKLTEIGGKRKETLVDYYYVNYPQIFDGKEYGPFFYTHEDIKNIVAYAAERYITVIPEIEMPGHAMAALAAYPELSCDPSIKYEPTGTWGVFEEVFCPKEETFKLLEDVIDEVIELFPSHYIHVGGDECPKTAWKKCVHCQALIKKLGLKDDITPSPIDGIKHSKEDKLQSYFITRMEKYINSKGKDIIGWDEILEGGLAPNATVMSWRGVEGGLNAAKAGHDAIMTPNGFAYLDYYQEDPAIAPTTIGGYVTLKKTYSYNPIPDDAEELVKKHIIGVQGNLWSEYIQTNERRDYQAFPRAIALAEIGWTENQNKDWKDFCKRLVNAFERMEVKNVNACRNFFEVNINTHVDNKELTVVLETYYPEAEIRYTIDGSMPTAQSALYSAPFTWTGEINLQTAVFKNGKMVGEVRSKSLYANLISGKAFTTTPAMGWTTGDIFGENDLLGADKTTFGLTNGKRGNNASYTPWTSFWINEKTNNELVFTVDLEQPTQISKVVFGSLYNPAYFMLPASALIVEGSVDGKEYTKIAEETFTREYPGKGRVAYTDMVTFDPTETKYVRLKFKSGGTLRNGIDCYKEVPDKIIPADLYLDEIEVY